MGHNSITAARQDVLQGVGVVARPGGLLLAGLLLGLLLPERRCGTAG